MQQCVYGNGAFCFRLYVGFIIEALKKVRAKCCGSGQHDDPETGVGLSGANETETLPEVQVGLSSLWKMSYCMYMQSKVVSSNLRETA